MRILVDARSMVEEAPSGVGFYASELTKTMLDISEHEFVLFTASLETPRYPEWTQHPRVTRVHKRVPSKLFHMCMTLFGLPRINRFVPDADLFWMPNLHFASWSRGAAAVLSVHDLSFERYPRFFSRKDRVWHWAVKGKTLTHNASAVVTDSQHTKEDLVDLWNVEAEKIHSIPLGVHADEWQTWQDNIEGVKDRYEIRRPYYLYVGNVEPRKNIVTLLEAYFAMVQEDQSVPDLVIAGKRDKRGQELYQWAQRLGVTDRVHFLGYVPSGHRASLYAGAEIFVYPSIYEGFGLPPLEAMAAGTPVITTPVSSLPEVCADAALYANPYDVNDLKRAMVTLWQDKEYQQTLIERGKKRVEELTWRKTAENMLALFEKLAK